MIDLQLYKKSYINTSIIIKYKTIDLNKDLIRIKGYVSINIISAKQFLITYIN